MYVSWSLSFHFTTIKLLPPWSDWQWLVPELYWLKLDQLLEQDNSCGHPTMMSTDWWLAGNSDFHPGPSHVNIVGLYCACLLKYIKIEMLSPHQSGWLLWQGHLQHLSEYQVKKNVPNVKFMVLSQVTYTHLDNCEPSTCTGRLEMKKKTKIFPVLFIYPST